MGNQPCNRGSKRIFNIQIKVKKYLTTILLLIASFFLNAQNAVLINGIGVSLTINDPSPASSILINGSFATGVSKQQINLSWANRNANKYIIEQATQSDYSDAEQIYAGNELSYAATGLSQNTTYYYRYSWSNDATTNTVFDTKSATTLNSGGSYDIDAAAIISAIQYDITLVDQAKVYINDFVVTSKATGKWNKAYTIHEGNFASWVANSINWKNPDFNNIEGLPEIYSGAVVHNNGEISYTGISASTELAAIRAFSTNWLIPSNYLSQNNKCYTFNITDAPETSLGDYYITGATIVSPTNSADKLSLRGLPSGVQQNDEAGISGNIVTGTNFLTTNLPATYTFQRSGSAAGNVLVRRNGVDILTTLNASNGQPTVPIATGGYYTNAPVPNPLGYKTYGRNFYSITESFDVTEMSEWESLISTLLTGLNSITFTPKTFTATTGRFVRFFGDSFTQWPAADATSGEKGWWVRAGQRFRILPISHASGGIGYYSQTNACLGALETPNLDRVCILIGYNDVKVFGTDPNGLEHAKSGIRSMITNSFLATAVAASDASVTKTGTWANPSLTGSKAAKQGGTALQSATSGDKISYVFSGDNVVVGVCNANGSTVIYGSVSVTVDGDSQGSYSANNKAYNVTSSGGRIWNAITFSGFGPGSHTIELTLESSVNFVVDYFGTLQDPEDCFPVVLMDIQYDATGVANRNTNAATLSSALRTMVSTEFSTYMSKIAFGSTNSFYNVNDPEQVSDDDVHPTDKGHRVGLYRSVERVWIY